MDTPEIQKSPEETPQTAGNEPQAPEAPAPTARIRGADGKFKSAKPSAETTPKPTAPKRKTHPENIDLRQHLDKSAARKIKRILNPPEEAEPEALPQEAGEEPPEELPDEEPQEDRKSQMFKTYGIIIGLIVCGIMAGWVFLRHRSKKLAAGSNQPFYAEA